MHPLTFVVAVGFYREMWLFAPGTKLSVMFSRQPSAETDELHEDGITNDIYMRGTTLRISDYNDGSNPSDV